MLEINQLKELLPFSKKLNILFIEDNEEVRNQIVKMLHNIFENIDTAQNGEEGLALYHQFFEEKERPYDIIITDLSMPKMDGVTFCKEIISIDEEQIILVLSAYTNPNKLLDLINLGIFKFIQKPIEQNNLLETMVAALNRLKKNQKIE